MSEWDNEDMDDDHDRDCDDQRSEEQDGDEDEFDARDERGYDFDEDDDRSIFADPGGNSALRAATKSNPRNLPCPTCKAPNRLTRADKVRGYQCDQCADRAESGMDGY